MTDKNGSELKQGDFENGMADAYYKFGKQYAPPKPTGS